MLDSKESGLGFHKSIWVLVLKTPSEVALESFYLKILFHSQGSLSTAKHDNTFGSVRLLVRVSVGISKYSKRSSETQVSYTLKKHRRVFISRGIQNGLAFKMVVVSTGGATAVDHTFNSKRGLTMLTADDDGHRNMQQTFVVHCNQLFVLVVLYH